MTNKILPELVKRFREKSSDYGNVFYDLGLGGQYSDMHRKMYKLKKAMWEGKELKGESPEEVLSDLLGNILISLYLYRYDEFGLNEIEARQRAAGAEPIGRQDTGAQRASTGHQKGREGQPTADEVRQPPSP